MSADKKESRDKCAGMIRGDNRGEFCFVNCRIYHRGGKFDMPEKLLYIAEIAAVLQ